MLVKQARDDSIHRQLPNKHIVDRNLLSLKQSIDLTHIHTEKIKKIETIS